MFLHFINYIKILSLFFYIISSITIMIVILSVIIQSELSSTGNVILHGNHQLFIRFIHRFGSFRFYYMFYSNINLGLKKIYCTNDSISK